MAARPSQPDPESDSDSLAKKQRPALKITRKSQSKRKPAQTPYSSTHKTTNLNPTSHEAAILHISESEISKTQLTVHVPHHQQINTQQPNTSNHASPSQNNKRKSKLKIVAAGRLKAKSLPTMKNKAKIQKIASTKTATLSSYLKEGEEDYVSDDKLDAASDDSIAELSREEEELS